MPGDIELRMGLDGLLSVFPQGPQRSANRIEHIQEDQRHVLVHVQPAIAGLVPRTAGVMKIFQHSGDSFEIFEALKLFFFNFLTPGAHGRY